MKIRTVLLAGVAAGIGYILGTAAGRARFEQIRGKANDFLGSPQVQDTVSNLSDTVKQNAAKLPDPVAGLVNVAADKATASTGASAAPDPSTSDLPDTSLGADSLDSSYTAEPETPFASDLPETSFDSDPLETTSLADPETPLASESDPLASELADADDPINPTTPPTTSSP